MEGCTDGRIDVAVIDQVADDFEYVLFGDVGELVSQGPGQDLGHVEHSVGDVAHRRCYLVEEEQRGALQELDGTLQTPLHLQVRKI